MPDPISFSEDSKCYGRTSLFKNMLECYVSVNLKEIVIIVDLADWLLNSKRILG